MTARMQPGTARLHPRTRMADAARGHAAAGRVRVAGKARSLAGLGLVLCGLAGAASADAVIDALEFEAARGDPAAQTELATLYEHSEGLSKDLKRAGALYCDAARRGYADAQFKLGWIYANGRGVPRDDATAAALFQQAAAQGHPDAVKLLAHIRPQADAQLPPCLAPDPVLRLAEEKPVVPVPPEDPLAETRSELAADQGRTPIERLVYGIAPGYAIDPELAIAMIAVESAFNPSAVSPKNAQGLMQLIPETAQRFGVKRVFDPVENIKGGLAYIRWLLAFFRGDVRLMLAAYNAGEGAVERHRGIPPYAETRRYVQKISAMYAKARHPFDETAAPSSALVAPPRQAPATPRPAATAMPVPTLVPTGHPVGNR